MSQLVAIAYPDPSLAPRAIAELERCADELLIDPDSAAYLICERDSSCQLTTSRRPGATAHWSKFWGMFLGAITNDPDAAAIDSAFILRLRGVLSPGTSVALVAIPRSRATQLLDALSPLGGETLTCGLTEDLPERWNVQGVRFTS